LLDRIQTDTDHDQDRCATERQVLDAAAVADLQEQVRQDRDHTEIWMGVESGAQTILDAMDKGLSLAAVAIARQRLKEAGIRACFFLQLGYPGEGWAELQQTFALVRELRPDDIGISFSYPLPGTVFYERVRMQLGAKRNWTDSDDLCIMFKAAYATEFYRAVREALHAEVDSWLDSSEKSTDHVASLWRIVDQLEAVSRDSEAFTFPESEEVFAVAGFLPVEQLTWTRKA